MARRFSIFLFGVLLGIMIIRFAFPGRFTEYMQYFSLDYRVIYHLNQDTIFFSKKTQYLLNCYDIKHNEIIDVLNDGEVNFDESDKNAIPCKLYVVEKDSLSVTFELCAENVKVKDFFFNSSDTCNYD